MDTLYWPVRSSSMRGGYGVDGYFNQLRVLLNRLHEILSKTPKIIYPFINIIYEGEIILFILTHTSTMMV